MSFANKTNGREYLNKSNPNSNSIQTMSYRNTLTNTQYSNSSNGDSYPYDDKSQQICNSPKVLSENHGLTQHNTCQRDPYYKGNNSRNKQYHNKSYNDKHVNYYNQRSISPEDIVIPEIENLREFVKEQADRFKFELSRHETQTSNSPSPGGHQYTDHANNRYTKSYGSLGRTGNGLTASHSLGSIANSNTSAPMATSTLSPSSSDNSNRHPDARMGSNSFAPKSNVNGHNYSKHLSQNSGKPSPGLTRNLSHDETFSKNPVVITNNKIRNDSPINVADKTVNNKTPFPCQPTSVGSKKTGYRPSPFSYASGANPAMHQMNQNNAVTALSVAIDGRKNDQQSRPTMSAVLRNGISSNSGGKPNQTRRRINRLESESEVMPNYRAVVSVADSSVAKRRVSHSGSTTDSQEMTHSVSVDTPTTHEQFFTPDPSASPCSTRSSPDVVAATFQCSRTGMSKPVTTIE